MLKGALHIHSTFSDGELTLTQLRDAFLSVGCVFACVTDHAEFFSASEVEEYRAQCSALSDEWFQFIPGLEYRCEAKMHILGYGVTSTCMGGDPQEVIRHIEAEGGIAVIAHPRDAVFQDIENFATLPSGIEVWNTKYDGRYAPRPACFHLLHRLQSRKRDMLAFYGQDLHWKRQYRGLLNFVDSSVVGRDGILNALRRGHFRGSKDEMRMPSDGRLPESTLERFGHLHERSAHIRSFLSRTNHLMSAVGVAIPARVKARFRRIF